MEKVNQRQIYTGESPEDLGPAAPGTNGTGYEGRVRYGKWAESREAKAGSLPSTGKVATFLFPYERLEIPL